MKVLILHRLPNGWLSIVEQPGSYPIRIEYDEEAPCWCCGLPVMSASMAGTVVCPWCDTGHHRDGRQITMAEQVAMRHRFDANMAVVKLQRLMNRPEGEEPEDDR